MHNVKQRQLLKEEVEFCISILSDQLCEYIKEPLKASRRILSSTSKQEAPWVLLPLITCESICGSFDKALPLCASLQFFMAAGDVFDDIEDNDSPLSMSSKYGAAISNNVATILLVLGEKSIARLKIKNVDDKKIVRILDTINNYYLSACTGQHEDLSNGKQIDISENDYLDILGLKSASQIECACYTGALLATEDETIFDTFKEFGYNLGMMAQIMNDISGIIKKKDIINKKITLPVIYALSQSEENVGNTLKQYYQNQSDTDSTIEKISDILSNSGALHYTAIKMESFRLSAFDTLKRAEQLGASVNSLREFLK
jgi:geranylgeranyl pyrophosphate synthase